MAFLIGGANSAAETGFEVANSCRFNGDAYLHKQLGTATNNKLCTVSLWVKPQVSDTRNTFISGGINGDNYQKFRTANDSFSFYGNHSGSNNLHLEANRKLRDPSAFYHVVMAFDSTQASSSNRIKIYVNGVQETSMNNATYPAEDAICYFNAASTSDIFVGAFGRQDDTIGEQGEGYFAEVCVIDGQALTPTSFGEYSETTPNLWIPKDVSGLTFGNNGFYLDFEASDNLGNDVNGGTDLTAVSLAATDQSTDTPTNNFATLNPLYKGSAGATTFSEGNLKFHETNSPSESSPGASTIAVANGKWYWEVYCEEDEAEDKFWIGASTVESAQNVLTAAGTSYIWGLRTGSTGVSLYNDVVYRNAGGSYTEVLTAGLTSGAASDGDIIKMAIDLDNGKVWFGKNDEWSNGSASISSTLDASNHDTTVTAGIDHYLGTGGEGAICWANFGSPARAISSGNADANGYGNFEYAVPSGFYSLCTKNLAEYG